MSRNRTFNLGATIIILTGACTIPAAISQETNPQPSPPTAAIPRSSTTAPTIIRNDTDTDAALQEIIQSEDLRPAQGLPLPQGGEPFSDEDLINQITGVNRIGAAADAQYSYTNQPLATVLRLLATQAGINYIEPNFRTNESVSVVLKDITAADAFRVIAESRGYQIRNRNGVLTLTRPDIDPASPSTIIKYRLRYIDPTWALQPIAGILGIDVATARDTNPTIPPPDAAAIIGPTAGGGGGGGTGSAGGGRADSSSGSRGGTSSTSGDLARPRWTPGIPWETPISRGSAARSGGPPGAANETYIFVDRKDNAVVIRAPANIQELVGEYINELDRPEDQILIDAKLVEVDVTNDTDMGVDWARVFGSGVSFSLTPNATPAPNSRAVPNTTAANTIFELYPSFYSLNWPQFQATLRHFATSGKAGSVSTPRVITRPGVPAYIQATTTTNVETFSNVVNATGATTLLSTGFQSFITGVTMDVIPRIYEDGMIELNVNPSVSSQTGSQFTSTGQEIPIISRRSTTTTVQVRDGYTVAIGGLMQYSEGTTNNGVPVLDKIPLIGEYLFNQRSRQKRRTNLIIFLTPRILKHNELIRQPIPKYEVEINANSERANESNAPAMARPVYSE
jgi:hypothetical protein